MRLGRESWHWQSLWWLAVLTVVVLLKHHYSMARVDQLDWILRPLSMLLQGLSGYSFQQNSVYEWVSVDANVRLVKGCAGLNFMVMSFMAYAWIFKPDVSAVNSCFSQIAGQLLLLSAALIAAWATSLGANSLRILVLMAMQSQAWQLGWHGLGAEQLHRLLGMIIYVPVLSLQMTLGHYIVSYHSNKRRGCAVYAAPVVLYFLLMVVVPVVTGNAWLNTQRFIDQCWIVLAMAVSMAFLLTARCCYQRQRVQA